MMPLVRDGGRRARPTRSGRGISLGAVESRSTAFVRPGRENDVLGSLLPRLSTTSKTVVAVATARRRARPVASPRPSRSVMSPMERAPPSAAQREEVGEWRRSIDPGVLGLARDVCASDQSAVQGEPRGGRPVVKPAVSASPPTAMGVRAGSRPRPRPGLAGAREDPGRAALGRKRRRGRGRARRRNRPWACRAGVKSSTAARASLGLCPPPPRCAGGHDCRAPSWARPPLGGGAPFVRPGSAPAAASALHGRVDEHENLNGR